MDYFLDKNKRVAIIGTILFHTLVVLVLIFTALKPPVPPRPEIGVEVNLGNNDQGMGNNQTEKPMQSIAASKPQPKNDKVRDKVVTQDVEQTVAVPDKKQNEKTVKSEPEEDVKPIDSRFILDKKKNKAIKGGSEGDDNTLGDKGKEDGDPNAKNYVGSSGNGISFSLKGRKGISLPKPKKNFTEDGTVTVKIWVNKSGKVYNAEVQVKGTNTSNPELRQLALQAAKASLFDAKPDAAETQVGTIVYIFNIE